MTTEILNVENLPTVYLSSGFSLQRFKDMRGKRRVAVMGVRGGFIGTLEYRAEDAESLAEDLPRPQLRLLDVGAGAQVLTMAEDVR